MRLFGICLASFLAAACGLSMNPDLPSGRETGDLAGDGDGDAGSETGDGDGDFLIDHPNGVGMGGCGAGGLGGASADDVECTKEAP